MKKSMKFNKMNLNNLMAKILKHMRKNNLLQLFIRPKNKRTVVVKKV